MRFTTAELDQILPLLHLEDVRWSYGYRPSLQKALYIPCAPVLALTPSRYDGLVWLLAVAIAHNL
jgi:hypothetical protein